MPTGTLRRAASEQRLRPGLVVLEEMSRGRHARITKAIDTRSKRVVALKRLRRDAKRDAELRQHSDALEALRRELTHESGRNAERARRIAELEQELHAEVQEERQLQARARELEQELSRRIAELEERAGRRDEELRERTAALEALGGELAGESGRGAEVARHCAELGSQLAAREEELRALRGECSALSGRGAEAARHGDELGAQLAAREEELRALRGECTELSARCESLARTAEGRARELDEHEFRLSQAAARVGELEAEVERNAGQRAGERLPMDELAESRLASALHGYAGQAPKALPPAYLERMKERDLFGALCSLLGGPEPLSSESMLALGEHWTRRQSAWNSEPIVGEVVYLWADACYVRSGLEQEGEALPGRGGEGGDQGRQHSGGLIG